MKQKLLYIIMFIATLAWSGEAWGDTWDQWFGKSGSGTQKGGTWYVLYNADEDFVGVGIGIPTSKEFDLLGPGTNLTFEANRNMATGIGSLKIEKYVNNTYSGHTIFDQNTGEYKNWSMHYVSYGPYDVSDATKLKFSENGASYKKLFRNVKVPMAQYVIESSETSSLSTINFSVDKVDNTSTNSFTIYWCNVPAMTYTVTGTNKDDVEVSITNNSEAGKYNTATVNVKYKRGIAGNLNATLTIKDTYGNYSKAITLTGSATKYNQTLSWNNESAINTSLKVDDTQNIPATSTSGLGVSYSSNNTSVLTVTSSGEITAKGAGTATITVAQAGNYKYNAATSISKTFTVTKYDQTLTWANPSVMNIVNGTTVSAAATASSGLTVSYLSDTPTVASVDIYGNVTGKSVSDSKVTITASQEGNYKYNAATPITRQLSVIARIQPEFSPSFGGTNPTIYVGDTPTITCSNTSTGFSYTSSDESVVGIEESDGVITLTALKTGTSTITLNQPETATHNAAGSTYTITVEKVSNTLGITTFATDKLVGETIVVDFTNRNNMGTPIVGTVTEQSLSSSVNNGANVITYDNNTNTITACNAGTAKITFTQAETNKYTGYTSATYSITVSKYTNTIIVTLNGEQRNTINIARSTQEAISQVTLGYTSSSESNGAFHVTRTLGSDDIASLSGNTITAGTTTDGINTWTISQDETYKFDPASTTVRVKVNSIAETESYLHTSYTDGSNYSWFTGGGDDYEVTVNYTPLLIRFKSWCDWGGIINESVTVTWKDANGKTINSRKTTISNNPQTIEVLLPENARQFSFSATGSLSQYISDVYVVRKTYVNASSNKTDFGTVYTDETPPTATITVDWGSSNGGNIEAVVANNNPHFTISPSTITGTANSNGTRNLIVTYTPSPNQLGEETANITIGDIFYSQQITLTATAAKHKNTLAIIGAQNKKVDDVISNVYSSKNSNATITPSLDREGVIAYDVSTNKITAVGAGTATLTLTQPANDYYLAATKSVTVTVTKYDQTLSWVNNLTDDDFKMEVGDVLTTNTARASSDLAVTYSSSNSSALEVDASTGKLTAKAGGSNIAITVTQAGNRKFNEATSITRYFTIYSRIDPTVTTTLSESETNIFPIGSSVITIGCNATITVDALSISDETKVSKSFLDNAFTLTALAEGTVIVTLTRAQDNSFNALSKTYTIQVVKPVIVLEPTVTPVFAYSEYSKVTLNRALKEGYSTIALPFDADVEELVGNDYDSATDWVAQLSVVTYNAHDGYSLYFSKSNTIEANQPYILHLGSAVNSPVFTDVSVVAAEEATQKTSNGVGYNDWTMHSNYDPAFKMNGYYGVVNGEGVLKKGTTGSTLKAFHAYITGPAAAGVKAAYLEEDEADAILELLKSEETGMENIYDLQGRQLPRAGKGINIIRNADGSVRKVMMRN